MDEKMECKESGELRSVPILYPEPEKSLGRVFLVFQGRSRTFLATGPTAPDSASSYVAGTSRGAHRHRDQERDFCTRLRSGRFLVLRQEKACEPDDVVSEASYELPFSEKFGGDTNSTETDSSSDGWIRSSVSNR